MHPIPASQGRIAGYRIDEDQSAGDTNIEQLSPRRCVEFAEREVMEYPTHSGLMPANWITLAHFSVSAAMKFANSAGELANTGEPKSAIRALIFGSARAALISLLSLSTISVGVFLGAPTPYQEFASTSPRIWTSAEVRPKPRLASLSMRASSLRNRRVGYPPP